MEGLMELFHNACVELAPALFPYICAVTSGRILPRPSEILGNLVGCLLVNVAGCAGRVFFSFRRHIPYLPPIGLVMERDLGVSSSSAEASGIHNAPQ